MGGDHREEVPPAALMGRKYKWLPIVFYSAAKIKDINLSTACIPLIRNALVAVWLLALLTGVDRRNSYWDE